MNRRTFFMSAVALPLATPLVTLAQNQGGRRSPEERQREAMKRLQEQLGATPDEMQVLTAKIEKVIAAQRNARGGAGMFGFGGGGGGRGGRGGQGGGGGDQPDTPLGKAAAELRTTLENKSAPEADVAAKLAALREARAKARAELDAARKELAAVVTPRQEAVMVSAGLLE